MLQRLPITFPFQYRPQVETRLIWLVLWLALMLIPAGCDRTEPTPDMVKIGIVNLTPTLDEIVDGFKTGMAELGYIEGKNVTYIYLGASVTTEAALPQIRHILDKNVDLILSMTTPVTLKVKEMLGERQTPVLFAPVTKPVEAGLVDDLRRPGGQFTGLILTTSPSKGLEWLLEAIPDLKRIYVPVNAEDEVMKSIADELEKAAMGRGIELVMPNVAKPEEVVSALTYIPPDVQAVWELPSGFWAPYLDLFIAAQMENKKLLMASNLAWTKLGAVMSIGSDLVTVGRQASRMADKLLRGTPPSLLPVERTDLSLYLNLRSARAIGVELPVPVLKKAKKIYR